MRRKTHTVAVRVSVLIDPSATEDAFVEGHLLVVLGAIQR
jgi:hypothetical protein